MEPSIAFWSYEKRESSEKIDEKEADPALPSRSSSISRVRGIEIEIDSHSSTSGACGDHLLQWWCNFSFHGK